MTENQNNKSNGTNRAKFYRRNKKEKFDPSKFYFMYGDGDIPPNMEVALMDYKPVVHSATTISQARGQVRSDIRRMGGNAAGCLTEERGSVAKTSWSYGSAMYTVSAYATLVVPVNLPAEEKEGLITRLKANIKFSEKVEKDLNWDFWKILLIPVIVFPTALLLIALYSWLR